MSICELRPDEAVNLDAERLDSICMQLGYSAAERAIGHAMEELADLLCKAKAAASVADLPQLSDCARKIQTLAESVGMYGLCRTAKDVDFLCGRTDQPALAATTARLLRIGEKSLMAIWDREDLIV